MANMTFTIGLELSAIMTSSHREYGGISQNSVGLSEVLSL
ncbi:hypothetical protein A1F99_109730 [Pyrenophora tritici-repentis]|nr:hypothetical protein A1F99_109730 [Pyrenophora tritici-repentis]